MHTTRKRDERGFFVVSADKGWEFKYEPETGFIGAYHPEGGKVSVLNFPDPRYGETYGEVIADLLNSMDLSNAD